jgi:photosystem II stability/assembly factor-like uncharacterized protein
MATRMLVGTKSGLWQAWDTPLEPVNEFTTRTVSALAQSGNEAWAIADGRIVQQRDGGRWTDRASLVNQRATCLATTPNGLLIGTTEAHLFLLDDTLVPVESFETVDGRETWHTPWGDPADVRSIAVDVDGAIYVNVHVGGVVRSRDAGRSWTPTVDIAADVHQVIAHPTRTRIVLAAAAQGFGVSRDGGDSWRFITDGMDASYARAIAVAGDTVLVSTSTGPRGHRAALYRTLLDGDEMFVRCSDGLPWFESNIDTGCLAAQGSLVVFGTDDGRLFRSLDGGAHWGLLSEGLPRITAVSIG